MHSPRLRNLAEGSEQLRPLNPNDQVAGFQPPSPERALGERNLTGQGFRTAFISRGPLSQPGKRSRGTWQVEWEGKAGCGNHRVPRALRRGGGVVDGEKGGSGCWATPEKSPIL